MVRRWLLLALIASCGDDGNQVVPHDAMPDAYLGTCDPLTQAPCGAADRCTWIYDDDGPDYNGHTQCVPRGTVALGGACTFMQTGAGFIDNCTTGACDSQPGVPGACRALCNPTGESPPACAANTTCILRQHAFDQLNLPKSAGFCEPSCDPLADNDFDGAAGPLTRSGVACGSSESCYGAPSRGTPPATGFACYVGPDNNLLRHRGVAPSPPFLNACSGGYQPLLRESTGSSTIVCVALCKPLNCYSGNCGINNANRLGAAPHRCNAVDRVGSFDTSANGEHCQFMWRLEIDSATRSYLPSPYSDTVGVCLDHSKYGLPSCASLPDGWGVPNTSIGAADLGCVDSSRLPMPATGKGPRRVPDSMVLPDDVRVLGVR